MGEGKKRIDRGEKGWNRKRRRQEEGFRDSGFSCKILEAFYAISHPMSEHIFFSCLYLVNINKVSLIFLCSIYGIYI